MTIKTKLATIMSCFALILLSLNIVLSYFSTRDNLRRDSEAHMLLTAKQIAVAVEQSRSVYEYVKLGLDYDASLNQIKTTLNMTSPERMVHESLRTNPSLLEIVGFHPQDFMVKRELLFGTYQMMNDEVVVKAAEEVIRSDESLLFDTTIQGKHVLESYIPIKPENQKPYVIRIISSYEPIASAISKQMLSEVSISLVLLQIVVFTSYILAGELVRPLQDIVMRITQLSSGCFETRLRVDRNDELGVLAFQVNAMADSIEQHTKELSQRNEEHRSMKEYLESIINQTADAIHVTDLDGQVMQVNSAFERLYGWNSEEIIGTRLNFLPENQQEDEQKTWRREFEGGRSSILIETVRLRKDGSEINVSISISPKYDFNGEITGYISISRDMTEHNKMEELLRRSEKLTTVGRLAAGVAHEIRNPLTTLRGFLQMQQKAKVVNQLHTDLMLSELDRINLIVSEFLILAKPQAVNFQTKDVRFTLGDVVSLLDSEAHLHNIEFKVHFPPDPILVHCEENQLKQVFINVLKNAMEAMPKGGKIYLRTDLDGEDQAIIQVVDEGEGIPKERLQKLGEPFYTNKEKGTGLGLMVTQRIIEGHKGELHIESEVGKGTVVTISLPCARITLDESDASYQLSKTSKLG